MKDAQALGFVGLALALAACGGKSDDQNAGSGSTGGASAFSNGGSSTNGGSSAPNVDRKCGVPDDCVVESLSCCPICGVPDPSNYVAMARSAQYDFQRSICAGNSACATCNAQVGTNTLLATCTQGQCALLNLLDSPVTACSSATDCYVHTPECCACGGSTDEYSVIALSSTSSIPYSSLVCPPNGACFDCGPVYPDVNVACISGHCRVTE
jgi:hypothetical protein